MAIGRRRRQHLRGRSRAGVRVRPDSAGSVGLV